MLSNERLGPLLSAIVANDDQQTEALVLQLTTAAEPALRQLLQEGTLDQRWWAIRALAHCGTEQSVPALLAALTDVDATLRTVAALAIGALYARLAQTITPNLSHLAARLADEDGMARQAAADALIGCGEGAIDALVAVLRNSTHEGARSRAAYALRKIGTPATAPALFRCLNDQNYLVHTYAYEALDEMGLLETLLMQ